MTPAAILDALGRHGVTVETGGGTARLAWNEGADPPPDLIEVARANREAVIALAVARGESGATGAVSGEDVPTDARAGLLRLAAMAPAGDFPASRWQKTVAACQYVGRHWLANALALGWSMPDVFGCHPVKPYAALHVAGLAVCLGARSITALTADAAALGGVTFRRQPAPGSARVLIWDLGAS